MTLQIQRMTQKIEEVRDAFHRAVFVDRDLDAAMDCVGDDGLVETVARRIGASGGDIRRFLSEDVLAHLPDGLEFARESKAADQRRVANDMTARFTHDRELPWLLPGVAATGREVETGVVSVASFKHTSRNGETQSRILTYRMTWDRLDVMAQLGLLDRESVASR